MLFSIEMLTLTGLGIQNFFVSVFHQQIADEEKKMGADLYIQSSYSALQAQYQQKFEAAIKLRNSANSEREKLKAQHQIEKLYDAMHPACAYFRDSYNDYSILAQLGLSWWREVLPRLDQNDRLALEDVMWLREEIRGRLLFCESRVSREQDAASELLATLASSNATSPAPVHRKFSAEDVEYFLGRKMALIAFLQSALDKGEEPVCSL